MWRPRAHAAVVLACAALAVASCASPAKQAAGLCEDLRNFSATIQTVTLPPPGETVGQARSELLKLTAVIESIEDSTVVGDQDAAELRAAQRSYLDELDGVGDDDPLASIVVRTGIAARRLALEFSSVAAGMGCPGAAGEFS